MTMTAEMRNQVDLELERWASGGDVVDLARAIHQAFGRRGSSQMRGLENVIMTATRPSECENFVRIQSGRSTAVSQQWRNFADTMLDQLAQLRRRAGEIAEDEVARIQCHLALLRGWMRLLMAHYLYVSVQGGNCGRRG